LDEPVKRLVPPFLVEIRYPRILTGEVLQQYLRALADYSMNVKKYQHKKAVNTWNKCSAAFFALFFPLGKSNTLRRKISSFKETGME
jgi:hypothetical protein